MPKRNDIKSILIIGAGPIIIGQACEFDYSGTQACRALREEGYRIILVNSNPATIMTDRNLADATYLEPVTPEAVSATKRLIAEVRGKEPDDVGSATIEKLANAWESESIKEGIDAFFSKRKPVWNPQS